MVEGISHLTFIVKDLGRTSTFFRTIFDAQEIYNSGGETHSFSREKFFLINGQWVVIMKGEPLGERTYNHVAFKISEDEFDVLEPRIRSLGLEIENPRPRIEGEGRSIYFYDYDNHLFELHTGTLADRLASYGWGGSA
ncbi:FosX/FosE/FosI family fosfomycin resistance hydrolase [Desulfitobacterium hafniense]|uniref:FosX/FosE/FosI family fosfomycin resistance hydrolase n=1 Tax=Desulfitobacterium hafniense TaxID=49338 RepID=UPI00036F6BB9|nr:FosX/FosE/FosI family fosfomycin resistance hydrolase [Desulfitobacterium hafniense]